MLASVRASWCGPEVYDVAQQLVESCLREDDSLFTPGREIWTLELAEALEGHVGEPDTGAGTFIEKLETQLAGVEPDAIQLAAEILFVQLLAEDDVKGERKLEHLNKILALAPGHAAIPANLKVALNAGGVASYGAGKAFRDAYMRFLLRLLAGWKQLDPGERVRTLDDPWAFLKVVEGFRTTTDAMTANALLHLVFPETFEYMIAPKDRSALIGAFAAAPEVEEAEGDNQKMIRIRAAATETLGRDVELYEDPFKRIWREDTPPAWTELLRWAKRLYERADFDQAERDYKLGLASMLDGVRMAIEGGEEWVDALRAALTDKENNLLDWRASDKFFNWTLEHSEQVPQMLRDLWAAEEHAAAIQEFLATFPRDAIPGQGTRISVASFLLLGADPTGSPFFKPSVHKDLRKALQLPALQLEIDPESTYRPEQLASSLGVDGKEVRAYLRDVFERDPSEKGSDWMLTGEQAEAVIEQFSDSSDPTTTVAPYVDWVSLLEELRLRMLGEGVVLRDLLDAQGLAYWIVQGAPPDDWPTAEKEAFLVFRGGVPGVGDRRLGNDREKRERTRREGKCQICEKVVPLEEQFTLENDLDNDVVIRTENAARPGAEEMSHYCADCVDERERGKLEWLRERRKRLDADEDEGRGGPLEGLSPATAQLAAELHLPEGWLQDAIDLLQAKKQLIFYGPPGTGKTYVAQSLAARLTGAGGEIRLVQFHPSYTYEDFFEGYRPRLRGDDGAIGFELVPGVLRELADRARLNPTAPHVLIVDEINRGNIAKVFGELYYLLEYRDKSIRLQYSSSESFSIPQNLLVIGTMNTADRSIALVDGALRRRFNFVEFNPTEDPVKKVLSLWLQRNELDPEPAALLDALNRAIDDGDFSIGPSYFMTSDGTEPNLEAVWRHAILPLLEERYYGSQRDVKREFGLAALRKKTADDADSADEQGERSAGRPSP